jgi:hypothetical protein
MARSIDMSGQGYHFAIGKEQTDALLACQSEEEILDITDHLVDSFHITGEGCGGDKGWDVLHRCLADGTFLPTGGKPPLNYPFLGGQLLVTEGSIVNLVQPEQVREAATAFAGMDGHWLRERFTDLFGAEYGDGIPEEDLERFTALFEELTTFFQQAAAEGKAVVFITDESLSDFH